MKFLRPIICAIVVFVVGFSFFYGLKKINYGDEKFNNGKQYKSIITVWHIDTFEGGKGSRAEFLLSLASDFEKKNDGVFVMVLTHTKQSAEKSYADGLVPDIVSYGYGAMPEKPFKFSEKTFKYAVFDGDCYALPWCRGGYVILVNKEIPENKLLDNAVVSQGEYNAPLVAAAFDGYVLNNPKITTPTEAYYKFITGSADYLIGTQRDINRLISRNGTANVIQLKKYNDLYQYISVTATDSLKKQYACAYVDYVLSETAQKKLYKIGMASAYYAVEFDNEYLQTLQNTANEYGFNVFNSVSEYDELRSLAQIACFGDESALKKIKKFVV